MTDDVTEQEQKLVHVSPWTTMEDLWVIATVQEGSDMEMIVFSPISGPMVVANEKAAKEMWEEASEMIAAFIPGQEVRLIKFTRTEVIDTLIEVVEPQGGE